LLASKWQLGFGLLLAALSGTALVIASACVFNNYIDRGIDAKMARTKKRALVSGLVSSQSALTYATMLGLLGFSILIVYTNALTVYLGLVALFTYVVLYGISKRRSVHGTVVGSIAGALPPVAGYTAVTNHLDSGALLLFLILVFWQMPHFYAIAIYRFKDYKAASLPVLPVKYGMRAAKLQIVIYTFVFTITTILLTVFGYTGYIFAIVMALVGLYWLSKGIQSFKATDDATWARGMFGTSLIVILCLAIMLSVGTILP
jgi:heme o synthase